MTIAVPTPPAMRLLDEDPGMARLRLFRLMLQRTQVEKTVGGGEVRHDEEDGRRAFAAALCARLERIASQNEADTRLAQCLRQLPDSAASAADKKTLAAQTAAAIQKHSELEDDLDILDAHMPHINLEDSKKATPTALRSPGGMHPHPAAFAFQHLRQPRSSRSPDWHPHHQPPAAIPPPPMTSSYPSPFANASALIKPLSARGKGGSGSPALQRHRAAAENSKSSPWLAGKGKVQAPGVTALLNRASDTSGIESGSSSNPSLVSAFHPASTHPPQLPAGGSLPRCPRPTPAARTGAGRSSPADKTRLSGSLGRSVSGRSRREAPPPLPPPAPGQLDLVYHLPDETVPYRVTCTTSGSQSLTLKEVKSRFPKKYLDSKEFKYFFKCKDGEGMELWTEVEADTSPVPLSQPELILAKIVHQ